MVSMRIYTLLLVSSLLASAAQAASMNKPYSPELFARSSLLADEAESSMSIKRGLPPKPYQPDLFARDTLLGSDDSSSDDDIVFERRKRSLSNGAAAPSPMERSSAATSTWNLMNMLSKRQPSEEELHERGLVDDAEIQKRGRCSADAHCGSNHYCSSKKNQCYRKLDNWNHCTRDGACGSGYCCDSSSKCEPKRDSGRNCHAKDSACSSGYCSVVSDKCKPQSPKGGGCRVDAGCSGNNSCVNGSCQASKPKNPTKPKPPSKDPHKPSPSGSPWHRRSLQHLDP